MIKCTQKYQMLNGENIQMSFTDTESIKSRKEKFTFLWNSIKCSGRDFLLIVLDLSDMNLFILASHVSAIRFSASALTPA